AVEKEDRDAADQRAPREPGLRHHSRGDGLPLHLPRAAEGPGALRRPRWAPGAPLLAPVGGRRDRAGRWPARRARVAHALGGVHLQRRDGGGVLHDAPTPRARADREPGRAGGALCLRLPAHRGPGPGTVEPRRHAGRVGRGGTLEQTSWLTPYDAETIAQAALRAGPGARLEVTVSPTVSAASLAAVNALFAWLLEKGVAVTVQRGEENGSG